MKKLKFNPDKDMKELEKYGYNFGIEYPIGKAYIKNLGYGDYISIRKDGRIHIEIEDFCGDNYEQFVNELLDDLIKANLLIMESDEDEL